MRMRYVTDERGEAGRYVAEEKRSLPPVTEAVVMSAPVYADLGDGRVRVATASGEVIGLFSSRELAERTVAFLCH